MPDQQQEVTGPDGKPYHFPTGTTKEQAVAYFKFKGIGATKTPDQLHAERAARANEGKTGIPTAEEQKAQQPGVIKNLAEGAGKSAAQGIQTAGKLVGAKVGEHMDLEPKGTAQHIGAGLETVAEYTAGEAALKAIPGVSALMAKSPKIAAALRGAMLGTSQAALHGEQHPIKSGLVTGAVGFGSEALGETLSKMAPKALAKSNALVNRYIGLQKSDLPKWERMKPGSAEDIAKTVVKEVGVKPTLEAQHVAIEAARDRIETQTDFILSQVPGRAIPIHANLNAITKSLGDKIFKAGQDYNGQAIRALNANIQEFKGIYGPNMTVQDGLKLRRILGKEIHWPQLSTTTDVRQMVLGEMYHSLNNSIESALPPDAAKSFAANNRLQQQLIIARDAAGEKLNAASMSKEPGTASKALTFAKRAAVGAGLGAAVGSFRGKEGAEEGAAVGAVVGAFGHHGRHVVGETDAPTRDVGFEKAVAKVSPAAADVIRRSPALARAFEAAVAAHGGGSGALASQK